MGFAWRLRADGALPGDDNMRVDAELLDAAVREGQCTLRLYEWDGPWLSLGYGQADVDRLEARCESAGVGIVRRMTGGAAVLHGGDLTYAVTAPQSALPDGLAGAYAWIAEILVQALSGLGLEVDRSPRPVRRAREFDCFAAPAAEEICVGGRKLVGSAQRRTRGALLQHGSIRLRPDPPAAVRAAGLGVSGTSLLEERDDIAPEALRDAIVTAFERAVGQALLAL